MEQLLIATPFRGGMDCWNAADWMMIISPVCLFMLPILYFFIYRKVGNEWKVLREKRDKWYPKYKEMEKGFGRK